jgi:(2Fe-2S) ferredoxin
MVVYPDGVWYRLRYRGSPGKRLNQEHLIGNMVVEEYAFLTQHVL